MISAKVIKPHTPFKAQFFRAELRAEAQKIGQEVKNDFEKTTKTWKHKPDFIVKTTETGNTATVEVATKDKIYGYIDLGTRPHIIKPRRAKRLAFASKFRPKTKVRVIGSSAGQHGKTDTFATVVRHPGTDAREFAQEIQAKWQPKLKARIETAITRAAHKSGHTVK